MRTPVFLRTSTIAQVQNAFSSSKVRSRRFPVTGSAPHILPTAVPRRVTTRASVCPPAVKGSPCPAGRAASSSSRASCSRWVTVWTRTGRTGRRSRVPAFLAPAGLLVADGAGRDPRPTPGRVIGSPLGDVQVEGPHRDEAFPVVQPGHLDLGRRAVRAGDRLGLGAQAFLPRVGDLAGQVQAADAGIVAL